MATGPAVEVVEEEKDRESLLQQAIANDDVVEVHNLIVEERGLLDRVSKFPFPNTPLHLAAAAGKTHVAMEVAILKPLFARELNPEGYSPMHLALQHEHYHTVRALMTIDPTLIRVRGQYGITPLHYVAEKEGDCELELLAEFLCACKSSIEDLTSRCETAVHVAVKNHNLKVFKVLFGWLKRVYLTEILSWKDEDGNTVLHIAVSTKQPEIIKMLMWYIKVDAKNFQDKTALEIFQENPSGDKYLAKRFGREGRLARLLTLNLPLSQYLSKEPTVFEKFTFFCGFQDESARDIVLLVAALIATATYQAALTPPGGYWQDNSSNPPANSTVVAANSSVVTVEKPREAGNIILNGSKLYLFTALNSMVFFVSILTIWIAAIPLLPQTMTVYLLTAFVGLSYFFTTIIEFPNSDNATGVFIVYFCMILLLIALVLPICLYAKYILVGTDATRRRVGNLLGLKDRK